VPGCAGVRSGVAVWRSIATERPATFLARPQMNPSRAVFHALLAFSRFRTFDCGYCIEMRTGVVWHRASFLFVQNSVNERNRDRSFPYRGRNALEVAAAYVSNREHSGPAGLE
jgi:hypothetical protein